MKAKLVSPDPCASESEIELEQFPVVIGRSSNAEIQPLDPTVSDQHCELEEIEGRLLVRDLGSKNGTYVNGLQIDMCPLLPGDELTVGRSHFVADYEVPAQKHRAQRHHGCADSQGEATSPLDCDILANVTFVELIHLLDRQRALYRQTSSDAIWRHEQMFPDPPHPEHVEHLLVEEMKTIGVQPQFIYAFEKTGILVTEFTYDSLTDDQLEQWQTAIEEYEDQFGDWDEEQRYPVGAITMYGPNKSDTTMVVAAVMRDADTKPVYQRWVGSTVKDDPKVKQQIQDFFLAHQVQSVIYVRENIACPHQEGLDYPLGEDCPFCPYWKGKRPN